MPVDDFHRCIVKNSFGDYLRKENKSTNTIKSYMTSINIFRRFLSNDSSKRLSEPNYSDASVFLNKQRISGISFQTLTKRVAALNLFFEFLDKPIELKMKNLNSVENSYINTNEKQVYVISKSAQQKFYHHASRTFKPRGIVLILLMLETGLSVSDVVGLNKSDLFEISNKAFIKFSEGQLIPITKDLYNSLKDIISEFPEHQPLFVSNQLRRLNVKTVQSSLKDYGVNAKILRDTYLSNLMKSCICENTINQLTLQFSDSHLKRFMNSEKVSEIDFVINKAL